MGTDLGASSAGVIVASAGRLPIFDVRFRGLPTLAQYKAMLDDLSRVILSGRPPIVILLDMQEFNPFDINASMRKEAADAWHANRELWLRTIAAEARIVVNPLARGMLTAFDWLTGTGKWPCKQFGNAADAEAWLMAKHAEATRIKR